MQICQYTFNGDVILFLFFLTTKYRIHAYFENIYRKWGTLLLKSTLLLLDSVYCGPIKASVVGEYYHIYIYIFYFIPLNWKPI